MKSLQWSILQSTHPLQDRWISVRADTCRTPNGQILAPYYVLEYPDYVHVFALTPTYEVILVRQYRHGRGQTLLELPSGHVDPTDTSPLEAAKRELLEETGYTSDQCIQVGTVSANPANHTNTSFCILAMNVQCVVDRPDEEGEGVEVVRLPLTEVAQKLVAGEFVQALYVSTLLYGLIHLGALQVTA